MVRDPYVKMSHKSNSRIRICIIGNQAFTLLNFNSPLVADMIKRGTEVFALASDYDEATRTAVRALGAEPVDYSLSRTGMNPVRDAADMLGLVFLLRQLKPDIILAYHTKPVISGTLAAWLAQVPQRFALITGLGYAFTPSTRSESLKRRLLRHLVMHLYRASLRHAKKVFFHNDDDRELFVNKGVVRSAQSVRINGIGVDLDRWQSASPVTNPVTFLLAARLLKEKGITEFVEAARRVKGMYPDASFILLGGLDSNPGALSPTEVKAWVAEGVIEWPGNVPDVRPWLARTSVYVLPSYREGLSRSTQEAMAMARPIITTDAPGCRETVIHGENGFLVPVHDAVALASAMEQFILHPDLIGRMGQSSRRIAEGRFDVRKINRIILKEMGIV